MRSGDLTRQYSGLNVTVMGLGLFGGGVGVTKFLAQAGAKVTVTDLRTESELAESIAELFDYPDIVFRLGTHDEKDFREADLIVANPAVKPDSAFLTTAATRGITITTELGLFVQHNPGRVIAVTGSNGKSTTSAMIDHVLRSNGIRSHLAGNIGESLLNRLDQIEENDWVVLEVSSFQLWHLSKMEFAPDIGVVTNFSPNHLDWHGSLDEYRKAKQGMIQFQFPQQTAVLNGDDPDVKNWDSPAKRVFFTTSRDDQSISRDSFSGSVSAAWKQNSQAAIKACEAVGFSQETSISTLKSFFGLPHRMEVIGPHKDRTFVNDSASTTPESTVVALDSSGPDTVLLFGGASKGLSMSNVAGAIRSTCKSVALYGETGEQVANALRSGSYRQTITSHSDLHTAFRDAVDQSQVGDTILFSPGSTSYGEFRNFHERGEQFRRLVSDYASQ